MARARICVLLACALVLLLAVAVSSAAAAKPKVPKTPKPPKPPKIVRCQSRKLFPYCTNFMACPSRCPHSCYVDCATCKPVCVCNAPGAVCYDPRFVGGDGVTFYFHGHKNQNFCLLSDSNLHINAHFIGKRGANMTRDFTWVDSISVLFEGHRLFLGAQKTDTWNDEVDRLAITFDGEPLQLDTEDGATWSSSSSPSVSIVRPSSTNAVMVDIEGKVKVTANVVPITQEDSKIHRYDVSSDDCLAHLELEFKFYELSGDVHGVLGQTYRENYVSRVDVSKKMPVMGGADKFSTSDLFATDCSVSRFGREIDEAMALPSEQEGLRCNSGVDGGVVCKK